jgi:hypothetical protein
MTYFKLTWAFIFALSCARPLYPPANDPARLDTVTIVTARGGEVRLSRFDADSLERRYLDRKPQSASKGRKPKNIEQ